MDLLLTIKESEVYPDKKPKGGKNDYRKAVRAVVFDNENNVALLHVSKYSYYKLPGGGIEESELMEESLKRECLEEIGCNVEVVSDVGRVFEYRDEINLNQESFCYIAKLLGGKGKSNLVGYEIDDGFETVWANIDKAIKMVEESKPTSYDGPFIKIRDLVFLKKAKDIIKK